MTQIYFTNTDNFTINDPELQDEAIIRLEKAMKREAMRIAASNSIEALRMAVRASGGAIKSWYDSL